MHRVAEIALCLGLLVSELNPPTHASQVWSNVPCPPQAPFSFCMVAEGPGTWVWLSQDWTALGIMVHPWLIHIRNPYTGQIIGQIDAPGPRRFSGWPVFSPDGRLLAVSVDDGTLRVWEVESGRELWKVSIFPREKTTAAFSPDGRLLSWLGPEGEIVVWDIEAGTKILSFHEFEPSGGAQVLGFSPDGRWLVGAIPWWAQVGSAHYTIVASVVWDLSIGHVARVFPGLVFFLPNGQLISPSIDPWPTMTVWDGVLGPQLRKVRLPWLQAVVGRPSVRPDGQYMAFGLADGTIRFLEISTGQEVARLDLKTVLGVGPEVEFRLAEVWFNPDGDLLLTVVWTPSEGKLQVHLWYVGELLRAVSVRP